MASPWPITATSEDAPTAPPIGLWARLRHVWARLWRREARGLTAGEHTALERVSSLESQVRELRQAIEERDGKIAVMSLEIRLLTDLCERDRARVRAETATYAMRQARGQGGSQ